MHMVELGDDLDTMLWIVISAWSTYIVAFGRSFLGSI
jgi:hypothetical protein